MRAFKEMYGWKTSYMTIMLREWFSFSVGNYAGKLVGVDWKTDGAKLKAILERKPFRGNNRLQTNTDFHPSSWMLCHNVT